MLSISDIDVLISGQNQSILFIVLHKDITA